MTELSVAMTSHASDALGLHLLRPDGQEDLCFATWRPSTGLHRTTAILHEPLLPLAGDRGVHGNASFEQRYLIRVAEAAARAGAGLAFLHSHPKATGWQGMSHPDRQAEQGMSRVAYALTGLPLVGLTLAGDDGCWSARIWDRHSASREATPTNCSTVRVIGPLVGIDFNPLKLPPPRSEPTQLRTVSAWGDRTQADIARMRVLIVGAGSIGMPIIEALARTGIRHITVLDPDRVELLNLDRLYGATRLDAAFRRPKAKLARRTLKKATTAAVAANLTAYDHSVCEPEGFRMALDHDIVFCCVDKPWPRHVLNVLAYHDLIPVIDCGIAIKHMPSGALRNAYWQTTDC